MPTTASGDHRSAGASPLNTLTVMMSDPANTPPRPRRYRGIHRRRLRLVAAGLSLVGIAGGAPIVLDRAHVPAPSPRGGTPAPVLVGRCRTVLVSPQPAADAPIWHGHPRSSGEGAVYQTHCPRPLAADDYGTFWSSAPPSSATGDLHRDTP